jgi:hypothetical protein
VVIGEGVSALRRTRAVSDLRNTINFMAAKPAYTRVRVENALTVQLNLWIGQEREVASKNT